MSILAKYSRTPSFYYALPSNNYFYDLSESDMSAINEVGVMPLTVLNHLSLKNPEKLFNGIAIEEIMRDCTTIRSINPRDILKCDVDFLLVGTKIATNGSTQSVRVQCPTCNEVHDYMINIESLLNKSTRHKKAYYVDIQVGLAEDRVTQNKLRIYVRPNTLGEFLRLEQEAFEDQKQIAAIQHDLSQITDESSFTEDDERNIMSKINTILSELTVDTMRIYSNTIQKIVVLDSDNNETMDYEDDKDAIFNFLLQLSESNYGNVKELISEINGVGINNIIPLTCQEDECEHKWDYTFEINMSDFFGVDS